jgi:molybdate transport system regulatory protein
MSFEPTCSLPEDAMADPIATVRFRLWLDSPEGMIFGIGRALLLKEIDECGSLNQAAKRLGMSYRGAWGKLKQTESVLGFPLCHKSRGRRGYTLTDGGRRVLNDFLRWQADVEEHAIRSAQRLLPWKISLDYPWR